MRDFCYYRDKSDLLRCDEGVLLPGERLLLGCTQFALDDGIGIVEEPSVWFEAGFGIVIISNTTDAPLEAFTGVVMFEGVGSLAGYAHEFTVGNAGIRPVIREMIGVEFVESRAVPRRADNDTFAVFLALFDRIHSSGYPIEGATEREISHSFGVRRGRGRELDESGNTGCQTVNNAGF